MYFETGANTGGTSLKGYLRLPRRTLEMIFGSSEGPSEDGKVLDEWSILIHHNGKDHAITIYDWKNYRLDSLPDDFDEWNIGGHTPECIDALQALFDQYNIVPDSLIRYQLA